ncbi:hypothetical protein HII31_09493 [Pseudocercospora fuligena]|uniref:Uncharacterized protein n=1 Tax=Pseudocercospora fuligena TaxID=685502 RepID=A0A8H6RDF3_9PEZI|nr:hypothetical protein HII31_09493 [Pseudocercospora fuligena]
MPLGKRRAESPGSTRSRKRLSLTSLAAKASTGSLRYEPDGSFLNIFMPGGRLKRNSTMSLRTPSRPLLRPTPLQPGLHLSHRPLQTHPDYDVASIKEITVFPTSLAMIKPNWIFRFTINCTPQLAPPLPDHIEQQLYQRYISSRLYPRPERLPYIHIGSTALGFRLNFYLILPYASTASGPSGTGNMCYSDLQRVYDGAIRPALESAYPRRQPWPCWMDAKNESHLKPLKSRRKSTRSEVQEERMHCEGLAAFWNAIEECSDNIEVAHLLRGKQLVAYGDVAVHDWQTDWRPTWAQFTQLWNDGVDSDFVGPDPKFTMEMSLSFEDQTTPTKEYRDSRSLDIGASDFPSPPYQRDGASTPQSMIHIPSFELSSARRTTPLRHVASMPPTRCTTPLSSNPLFPPPSAAPPSCPLPPIPPNVVVKKRSSRRMSSRHSIKIVDPPVGMGDLSELAEPE